MRVDKNSNIIKTVRIIEPTIIKQSSQPEYSESTTLNNYYPHPLNYKTLKEIENSFHNRAISFKAACAVGLGFKLIDKNGEPLKEPPTIFEEANPLESFQEVINCVALDLEHTGLGYLEVVKNIKGDPAELYWIPAETMYFAKSKDHFIQDINGKTQKFNIFGRDDSKGINSVIRFRIPSNRSQYYSIPDWLGCVAPILLDALAVEWNYNFFQNNCVPSFAIIVEGGEFSKEVDKRISDFLTNNYKGPLNVNRTLYLPIKNEKIKVTFQEITKKGNDGEWQNLRLNIRDEIISAHGVPPRLMGVISPGSLGGGGEVSQQIQTFKECLIAPRQRLIESIINRTLGKAFNCQIDFNEIDITPQTDDVQEVVNLVMAGILDSDEGRTRLGITSSAQKSEQKARDLLTQIINLRKMLKDYD